MRYLARLLTLLCVLRGPTTRAAERANVVLILVDDLKPSFGAYGDGWVQAPNLDRLAVHGMRFDGAYCNQAVCAPSRNNLLSTLAEAYPQQLGRRCFVSRLLVKSAPENRALR